MVLASRDPARGEAAAAELGAAGLEVRAAELNVADSASVRRLATSLERDLGGVDVLINNAAILLDEEGDVLRIPDESFRASFETNVMGPLRLCQALVPGMRARGYGRVVNVSSGAGQLAGMPPVAPVAARAASAPLGWE